MIYGRVEAHRTIILGRWREVKAELTAQGRDACIFPMGAVPKPQDPSTFRATDANALSLRRMYSLACAGLGG